MRTKRNSFLAAAILIFLLSLANISAAQDRADLSITNTAQPNPATVSTPTVPKNISYGMNVINNGPDGATGVKVNFTISDRTTLVSATFTFIEPTLHVTVGGVAVHGSQSAFMKLKVAEARCVW